MGQTHETVIKRRIPATPEAVFNAWTDAEGMTKWLAISGRVSADIRTGGKFEIDMQHERKVYPHHGEFLRVEPPSLIEFTWFSEGTQQQRSVVTVELRDVVGETELILTHRGLPTVKSANDHWEGWTRIIGQLKDVLTKRKAA